jgi:hypothetical protein
VGSFDKSGVKPPLVLGRYVTHTRTMPGPRRKRPRDPAQLAKLIIDIASGEVEDRSPTPEEQGKDPAAAVLGQKGGRARATSLSEAKRKEIAKRAAATRWKKG